MSGNEKRPLVPRFRFPEFREAGEWAERLLNDVCEINPAKTIKRDDESVSFVPMAAVSEDGKIERPEVRTYAEVKKGYTSFIDNDVIIAKITPCFENGKAALAVDLKNGAGYGSTEFHVFRAQEGCLPEFLFMQINREEIRKVGARSMVGNAGQRRIPASFFETLPFYLPSCAEQQKIADCLSSLNVLITAENQKLDAIRTYKKGLVQQLFPREVETVPRLRFPAFRKAGKWQKRKVSDLLVRSVSPVSVDVDDAYQEIGIRSHGKGIFHKELISGKALGDKRVFWVEENAFVVNIVFAWEQAVAVTSAAEKEMIASHRFPMYKPKNNSSDVHFVKYFFLTNKGKELLGIASPGGAGRNKTLGQKEFENLDLLFPGDVEEQTEIANILSSLDDLIAAQSKKVDALKTHKQGLMQQLFPALDAVQA
ncbi:restriction endonuclease subunit S [Pseudomonas aeruginosa]